MKTFKTALLMALLVGSITGCAKQRAYESPNAPDATRNGDAVAPGQVVQAQYGSNVAQLSDFSADALRQFFFKNPPNNPSNVRVLVDLSKDSDGYGGELKIQFDDNGITRQAVLSSHHPYTNVSDSRLDQWFVYNGANVFHGIYQDIAGAVVITVDHSLSLGDGSGSAILSGTIWFQNFGFTNAAQGPNLMCWEIQIGPYDCRTFLQGGVNARYDQAVVNTYSSLYPTTHTLGGDATNSYNGSFGGDRPAYTKLGTYTGLLRSAAFHE